MAPPASPTEEAAPNDKDNDPNADNGKKSHCSASSRDKFLCRLEQQQQKERKKAAEDGGDAPAPLALKEGAESGVAASMLSEKWGGSPGSQSNVIQKNNEEEPPSARDQLLLDYLSQYCQESTGNCCGTAGTSSSSNPSEWLQDVDPSSLALLKGLAGIQDDAAPPVDPAIVALAANNAAAASVPPASASYSHGSGNLYHDPLPPGTNVPPWKEEVFVPKPDEPTKTWEVHVPEGAVPGQPFVLSAGGVRIRVICPANASAGQRVRFTLPDTLFTTEVTIEGQEPPLSAPTGEARSGAAAAGIALGAPFASAGTPKEDANSTNGGSNNHTSETANGDPRLLQQRMLNLIEQQQSQMYEMQARLDALGGMMSRMEQDVRHLRRDGGRHPGGQGMFGGLLGRNEPPRDAPPPVPPPSLHDLQERLRRCGFVEDLDVLDPQPAPLPPPGPQPPEAIEVPPPRAPHDPAAAPVHQGLFFPLFAFLFRFLAAAPHRLRAVMTTTGPGRVYARLRRRAVDQRAFADVDLASLVKLLVMLLIFTGRVGRDGSGGATRQNGRRGRDADEEADGGEASMLAHAYTLLQRLGEYAAGHRIHMMVVAALMAFLVQVGLMSFFYKVVWVERDELWRAWMGQEEAEGGEEDENGGAGGNNRAGGGDGGDGGDGGGDGGAGGGGGDALGGNDRRNPAVGPNAVEAHADNAAAAGPPGIGGGGMIRRGPNNGGFFHDVQCLVVSFFMSLVPAWRLEAAAAPPAAVEGAPPQQQRQQAEDAGQPANEAERGRQQPQPGRDGGANGEEHGAEERRED